MKRLATYLVCGVWAAAVLAEDPLTLEGCLREAAENNPDLAASKAAAQKARFDYRASYGDLLPQVKVGADTGRSSSESDVNEIVNTRNSASYKVSASQSLFTGGRNKAAVDKSSASLRSAEADLDDRRATLSYDVCKAFAELLYAQEQIDLAQTILQRRKDNLDLIQLRYEGGRENKGALLLTEASAKDAEYGVTEAGRYAQVARQQMACALGRDEAAPIAATGRLAAKAPPASADLEALAAKTPSFRRAEAQVLVARAGLDSARSKYFPELAANASAGRAGEGWMPEQDEWFLGLTLGFPVFQGGKNVMTARGARAEVDRAESNRRSADAELILVLQKALNDYADAVERIGVLAAYVTAEEVRAEIARTQYASGMLSFEDWDRIENGLIGRQKESLSGRRNAALAESAWDKAQGSSRLPE